MPNPRKKSLQSKLDGMDLNERSKLYKRARQMRKIAQNPRSRARNGADYDVRGGLERMKTRSKSLDDYVTELLEGADFDPTPDDAAPGDTDFEATVVQLRPEHCEVEWDGERISCQLSGDLALSQRTDLAVGDVVQIKVTEYGHLAHGVLPRRTRLSRPDPHYGEIIERVVAANIDFVVIVASLKTPPLRPRLIDRYLLAIRQGGAKPIICVNKSDLLTGDELAKQLKKLDPYRSLDVPILRVSALRREGTAALIQHVASSTCAFVGHSGVGKSSLLNAIAPELELDTGHVTQYAGKGRHTTTASTMYDIGDGIRIIDTPGIRSFGLAKLAAAELRWYFDEFTAYAQQCRFDDCSHAHEPKCAVRAAAESGAISDYRYQTYLGLLAEIGGG